MKKKFIYIFVFFIIFIPSYASEKIVYLDVEKIMQESVAGKSIISQLKKKRENTVSKFKKKEKEIINKEKTLISQKNILNKDEFEKKIKDLRKDISIFQKERAKSANSIAQSRITGTKKLLKNLTPILEEYSKKNSIKIIVQKKNIVMGKKEDDITSDILNLINQKVKNIKID